MAATDRLRCIGVLLLGTALRLPFALDEGITGDEAFCVLISRCSSWDILSGEALEDSNPPLYMLFLHGAMAVAPDHVWVWKTLTLLVNVASIAVIMAVVHRWVGSTAALAAGILAAINPWQIYLATELRGYALAGFLSVVAIDSADRYERTGRLRWASLWGLACAAGFWTHYSVAVVGVVTGVNTLIGIRRHRAWVMIWCAAGVAAVAVMALWVPRMMEQAIQRGGRWQHLWHLGGLPIVQALGTTFLRPELNLVWLLMGGLITLAAFGWPAVIGIIKLWSTHRRLAIFSLALLFVSVAVPLIRSLTIGSLGFSTRYTFVAQIAFFLVVSYGMASMSGVLRFSTWSVIIVLTAISLLQFRWSYVGRSLWDTMMARLEENVDDEDALLLPNLAQPMRIRLLTGDAFPQCFVTRPDQRYPGFVPLDTGYVEMSRLMRHPEEFYTKSTGRRLMTFDVIWYWPPISAGETPPVLGTDYQLDKVVKLLPGGEFGAEGPVDLARYRRTRS